MSDYYANAEAVLPLWRKTDPDTSKAAGEAAREFLGDHERLILEALAAGPGTKDEIAGRCGLTEQQVARRMHGLARLGRVADTGTTRSTASGRMATVWRVA
jgi:predicted ArsR family transcriptional regulator